MEIKSKNMLLQKIIRCQSFINSIITQKKNICIKNATLASFIYSIIFFNFENILAFMYTCSR